MQEDPAITQYYRLHPEQFPILKKMEILQYVSEKFPPCIDLEVVSGRPLRKSDTRKLRIVFHNVVNFSFSYKRTSIVGFDGFEILSIRDRHWENLHYEVKEGGHGIKEEFISFLCDNFEATIEENC